MMSSVASSSFSIGWDVGAWNCDKNGKSRDAIVILDNALTVVGQPWRGNLRQCISESDTTSQWLTALFKICYANFPGGAVKVTMAIDTPLGFSEELVALLTRKSHVDPDGASGRNRYLFRATERHLFERGLTPLSAVKDMIGSQATKGMHVLAKFAVQIESCGVWTDGHGFRVIETYPSACRKAPAVAGILNGRASLGHHDIDDACFCAVVAHLFATKRDFLEAPPDQVPQNEGWIWVPTQSWPTRES